MKIQNIEMEESGCQKTLGSGQSILSYNYQEIHVSAYRRQSAAPRYQHHVVTITASSPMLHSFVGQRRPQLDVLPVTSPETFLHLFLCEEQTHCGTRDKRLDLWVILNLMSQESLCGRLLALFRYIGWRMAVAFGMFELLHWSIIRTLSAL